MLPSQIHVLIEPQGDWFVAQCVEYDLATQARALDALYLEIEPLLAAYLQSCKDLGQVPFDMPPAPNVVGQKFDLAVTGSRAYSCKTFSFTWGDLRLVIDCCEAS